ncbi:pantoate--beta-alanine ligase [Chloroflexota bacterium]
MKVIETVAEMGQLRSELTEPVGLVPTMGYLHDGHLSLVKQARTENPIVVASIFVNPTQFGPQEDLASYPRDIQRDLSLLEKEKTDIVFMPSANEMYPPQFDSWVEVAGITEKLEGSSRPNHFRGVTTVVAKLFNIVQPTRAYFGQKDAQQLLVIRKMATNLNMNLAVVTCPTVREPDGLAMSSRNSYLNPEERQAAAVLYQSLILARQMWAQGETGAEEIRRKMIELIQRQPLAVIDYVSITDTETLEELDEVNPPALVSLAVKIGKPRLIDNTILD